MRKHNLIMLLMSLVTAFTVSAGEQFVPKEYSYEEVGSDASKSFYVYFYNLFTYPDDITTKTDISKRDDITISVSSGDESIMKLSTIGAHMNQTRLQLTRLGGVKGETTFSVSITYKGETVTNTFPVKVRGIETSLIKSYIEPDCSDAMIFDVIGNTKFYKSSETELCSLTIDNAEELKHGSAELVDGENGHKVISYTLSGTPKQIVSDVIKYTITLSDGTEYSTNKIITYATRNCYATKVLEYQPAAGQFRVEEAWDNVTEFFESDQRGVSLGALGGYIVLGFDQPIYNNPQNPYGVDFTVEGNSFIADVKGVWTEPGAVQVMEDKNGDGIPNDGEWYELAGSDYWLSTTKHNVELTYYNPHYNDRYTVPWSMKWEENGETKYEYGAVVTNNFHKHTFYPDYFYNQDNPDESKRWYNPSISRDSITFTGISQIKGFIDMRSPSYIEFYSVSGFGYCDNKGFVKDDSRIAQNPYARHELGETAGDGMDISWAVDKDGNYVDLEKIDFVKVYTAGQVIAGWLGEWSTEVLNCAITLPDPEYVPQDYYYNYAGITQLQVPKGHTCQYEGFLFKNGRPVNDVTQRWWLTMDQDGLVIEGVDEIASIDNNGLFTAKEKGNVWVHFSAMDGIPEETFEVSVCNLTAVVINLEGNTGPDSETLSCVVGERVYINVESEDENAENVNETKSNRFIYDSYTWLNSNPEVGVIDKGTFVALQPGVATLTAVSGIDSSLSDQIVVTVHDIPEIEILPIKISANAPVGELLNSDIFATGNSATVYMEDVCATKGNANVSLYNNHLYYEFTEGEYTSDILKFKVTCYGQESELEVPITYGPFNLATRKKLLMINSFDEYGTGIGVAQLQGIDAETYETKTYVESLAEVPSEVTLPTDNVLADGAYAYVTRGVNLTRYDVEWDKAVAETTLTSTSKHQLAAYKDKLLVSDGNMLKVFYRTNLKQFKTIELSANIEQMAVNGDVAHVLTTTNESAMISEINLSTFAANYTDVALVGGNNASGMYSHNNKLYIATGETSDGAASMVVFNPSDKSSAIISAASEGALQGPHSVSVKVGNNIMVSRGAGFVAYNLETETFAENTVMSVNDMIVPVLAVGETYELDGKTHERYYVAYSQGMAVFDSSDLTTPERSFNFAPRAMNIMQETAENEAPTVKKAYAVTSGIYERSTSAKSCSAAKLSTYFSDTEGSDINNYAMYIREDVDWLDVTYGTDGKVTPKATFTGEVDDKTDFVFEFECIDKYGASVMSTATFTVIPRIYKPIITETEINMISGAENMVSVNRAITDIFNQNGQNSSCTLTTVVTNISDNDININAEVVDGNLVVTVPANVDGNATIELTQTLTHKTTKYGTKEFKAVIPVVIVNGKATSIELDVTEKELLIGEHFALVVTVLPDFATNKEVVWTTSNESVVTVDAAGVVTAIGIGDAIITASTTDGSNLAATCSVKVKDVSTGIAFSEMSDGALYVENNKIVVTGVPDKSKVCVYTTSGTLVASKQAQNGYVSIRVPNNIYIVKYDGKVVKISVM